MQSRVKDSLYSIIVIFVLFFSFAPIPAHAFGDTGCPVAKYPGYAGSDADGDKYYDDTLDTAFGCVNENSNVLADFTSRVYAIALFLGATLAVIMIVIGGIQYITSSGSPDSIQGAKDRITSALWGMAILILAAVIFRTIGVTGL